MKRSDYIAAFALALFLHGVILTAMAGIWRGASAPARPLFQQGESSMAVTFAALPPRAESGAARDAPPAGAPVYTEPEHAEITQPVFVPPIPRIRPMTPVPLIALPDKRAPHDRARNRMFPQWNSRAFAKPRRPTRRPGRAGSQPGAWAKLSQLRHPGMDGAPRVPDGRAASRRRRQRHRARGGGRGRTGKRAGSDNVQRLQGFGPVGAQGNRPRAFFARPEERKADGVRDSHQIPFPA